MRGWLALICVSLLSVVASADVTYLPRTKNEFKMFMPLVEFDNQFIPGAEVAWANYKLLRRDFPGLADFTDSQIENWIVQNASYISQQQRYLDGIRNTPMPTGGPTKPSFRQMPLQTITEKRNVHNQGRADIMQALGPNGEDWGYIDRKGVGITDEGMARSDKFLQELGLEGLRMRSGSNGTVLFGQAIIEVAMMGAAQNYLQYINHKIPTPFESIEYYFILKLPMNALLSNGRLSPLAIVGRQAHVGRVWANNVLAKKLFNTKQFDFFGSTIDPETMKIYDSIFDSSRPLVWHPRDMELYFNRAKDIVEQYQNGDKQAIQRFIDLVSAPLVDAQKNIPVLRVERHNLQQSYDRILHWVESDPMRFHRFTEVAVWALNRNSINNLNLELTQKVARQLLALPKENDPIENLWARRYGLFLLPIFPAQERKQWLEREIQDPASYIYLAQMVWLLPWEEGSKYISRILNSEGSMFTMSLANKLIQKDVVEDKRYRDFQKYFAMALRHSKTRKQALEYQKRMSCEWLLL